MKKSELSILFLPSWYPSREHATIGNFVQRHAHAAALYHRIVVVAAIESTESETGITEHDNLCEIRVYFKKKLPLISYQKAMKKGIKLAREKFGEFDLAHVHVAYPAGFVAAQLKLPYIVTEHFSGYHPQSGFKWSNARKSLTRKILKRAKVILPVSEHLGNAIRAFEVNTPILQISNVVDTSIFYPHSELPEKFTFLHISTLEERSKNISGILQGLRQLEGAGFDFVINIGGDGDLSKLEEKIRNFGPSPDRVKIISQQNIGGIAELMRQAHCLLMFSHFENQPCTILEALCCGIPVISSDVGGIPEVINSDNGILIPAKDDKAFVNGLREMMIKYSRYDRTKISTNAAGLYSYETIGRKLSDVYFSVLNSDASSF